MRVRDTRNGLECLRNPLLAAMALDIEVEEILPGFPLDRTKLNRREIDLSVRKRLKQAVKTSGLVLADREHGRGQIVTRGRGCLFADDQEPGRVVAPIFDRLLDGSKPVGFSSTRAADRRHRTILGGQLCGCGSTGRLQAIDSG